MKAIQKKGLGIPKDIGIISISHGFIPSLFDPAITYVETNGSKLGKLAFTRLKEILAGQTSIKELVIDARLVEGGSL
jgi:LacI family transcriptional regulator